MMTDSIEWVAYSLLWQGDLKKWPVKGNEKCNLQNAENLLNWWVHPLKEICNIFGNFLTFPAQAKGNEDRIRIKILLADNSNHKHFYGISCTIYAYKKCFFFLFLRRIRQNPPPMAFTQLL